MLSAKFVSGLVPSTTNNEPIRKAARGTRRVYSRPSVDGTDEELHAWAVSFANAILGTNKDDKHADPSSYACGLTVLPTGVRGAYTSTDR
jgi:hypothetical protein